MQAPGQGQLPAQPSQRSSPPVQLLFTPSFAPGRVGRGRGQAEHPDQAKLQVQPSAFRPQPGKGVSRRLAFRPDLAPLDDQFSRRTVDLLLARLRLLRDQLRGRRGAV